MSPSHQPLASLPRDQRQRVYEFAAEERRRTANVLWVIAGLVAAAFILFVVHLLDRTAGSSSASRFTDTGQFGDSFGALTSLFTGVAVAGALAAVFMEQQARRREALTKLLEIFREWDGPRMRHARDVGWLARERWLTNPAYRHLQLSLMLECSAVENEWRRDFPDAYRTAVEDRCAVWSLIEFYWMVAQLPRSMGPVVAEWGFYYPWWRGFLQSWFTLRDNRYEQMLGRFPSHNDPAACAQCRAVRQLPREPWVATLKRLDDMFGLPPYSQMDHPIDHFDALPPAARPHRDTALDTELRVLDEHLRAAPRPAAPAAP